MKDTILVIIGLILILLTSPMTIGQESGSFKTFVIEGNKENIDSNNGGMVVFEIGQKPTGRSELIGLKEGSKCARERNLRYQRIEEEVDKCIDKITKNWKRTYFRRSHEKIYDEDGELIETNEFWEKERSFYGYDEDEDWDLRWKLRNRALNGEKIC